MLPGFGFGLSMDLANGQYYRIQRSSDLKAWQDWMSIQGNGGPQTVYDPQTQTVPSRFYRLVFP